jgi:hypothetical protein
MVAHLIQAKWAPSMCAECDAQTDAQEFLRVKRRLHPLDMKRAAVRWPVTTAYKVLRDRVGGNPKAHPNPDRVPVSQQRQLSREERLALKRYKSLGRQIEYLGLFHAYSDGLPLEAHVIDAMFADDARLPLRYDPGEDGAGEYGSLDEEEWENPTGRDATDPGAFSP